MAGNNNNSSHDSQEGGTTSHRRPRAYVFDITRPQFAIPTPLFPLTIVLAFVIFHLYACWPLMLSLGSLNS